MFLRPTSSPFMAITALPRSSMGIASALLLLFSPVLCSYVVSQESASATQAWNVPSASDLNIDSTHAPQPHFLFDSNRLTQTHNLPSSAAEGDAGLNLFSPASFTANESSSESPKSDTTSTDELLKRIDALEKDVEKQAKASVKAASDKKKEEDTTNKWKVKLGGHIQMDYVTWVDGDANIPDTDNYFNFRRLRLVADGTGYQQFDFRLQMTLEPGQGANTNQFASPDVKDAYVSMNEIPGLGRFRIGNFFVPFSLEQVTNDTNNIFVERSIPTQGIFAADREVGVALYNCNDDETVTWCGGVFFDEISETFKTTFGDSLGQRISGRLTWLPYYDAESEGRYLIHTGVGVLHTNDADDRVRFRARPQVQRGPILIDTGNLLANSYTTGNLELAVVCGPVTIQNEAFISTVHLLNGDSERVGGAYSHVSYFLTGENRIFEPFGQHGAQFARNKPIKNFYLTKDGCGWGAVETKARWSYLDVNNVGGGQYNDLTAGFNWYWSDRTRIMFDWIHPLTTGDTTFGATESDLFAMRFDVNW